ncbi:CaiB/BaiF CoA transferase family protein [Acuticoccus sp.]|uniref:CaiB/BaiF CoA transferase family protein n=1 Tax=Acuticoccus sp. TaxID=1904378 RepID=UPI003B526FEB
MTIEPVAHEGDARRPLRPFEGLVILDLSQGLAAPYAVQMMAALGASITKVEPPEGDWGRHMGERVGAMSSLFLMANAGKRSIVVDAARPEGRDLLLRLARGADMVVDSFRPGVLRKLGMTFDALKAVADPVVQVSVTGYGSDGPYAKRPGSDSILQAHTGMVVVNRTPSGEPHRIGMLAVDMTAGLYTSVVLAAAAAELRAGGGSRRIETSLLHTALTFQAMPLLAHQMTGGRPAGAVTAPSGMFRTADGTITVTCLRDRMFAALAEALEAPQWVADERYATNAARVANVASLHAAMAEVLGTRTSQAWLDLLQAAGVLCGPVNDYAALLDDPQVRHCELVAPLHAAEVGEVLLPRLPGLGIAPGDPGFSSPPLPGEHTRAILTEHGFAAAEIDAMADAGTIHTREVLA